MPNIRVNNSSPNIRVGNASPSIRSSLAMSATKATKGITFGGKGYPLGILLAITADRRRTLPTTYSGGLITPNMRIFNI